MQLNRERFPVGLSASGPGTQLAATVMLLVLSLVSGLGLGAGDPASRLTARRYSIDPFRSYLEFSVGFMRIKTESGTFHEYSGTIMYAPERLQDSSVTVVVKADSIFTGVKPRDKHLRSADFFDVENFPYIVFRSSQVEPSGKDWIVTGSLTLHGVARPVKIRFRPQAGRKDRLVFEGNLELRRREFGIVGNFWGNQVLGNRVQVDLHIEAAPVEEGSFKPPRFTRKVLSEALMDAALDSNPDRLRQDFHELMVTSPGDYDFGPEGLLELAVALNQENRPAAARRVLRFNLDNHPAHTTTLDFLAYLEALEGNTAEAVAIYRRLTRQNPYDPGPQEMLRWLMATDGSPAAAQTATPPKKGQLR